MPVHPLTTAAPSARTRTAQDVARVAAAAAGVAAVLNVLVLLVGRTAGADMVVGQPGAAQTIGVVAVVVSTLVGLLAGSLLLLVLRDRGPRAWVAVGVTGLLVGVATVPVPLSMPAERATHVTLTAMHVVTGLVWFLVVRQRQR